MRLERDGVVRRIPTGPRIVQPALATGDAEAPPDAPVVYTGDTRGGHNRDRPLPLPRAARRRRTRERAPRARAGVPRPAPRAGRELRRRRRHSDARGATVEPRIVAAGNESRLMGYAALPIILNPYLAGFETPVLASGVLRPSRGRLRRRLRQPHAAPARALHVPALDRRRQHLRPSTLPHADRVSRDRRSSSRVADAGSGVDAVVDHRHGRRHAARDPPPARAGIVLRMPTLGLTPARTGSACRSRTTRRRGTTRTSAADPAEHAASCGRAKIADVVGLARRYLAAVRASSRGSSIVGSESRSRCTLSRTRPSRGRS